MKRRYVVAGLAAVATLAIASSAVGGPSIKKLVKKEVSKQISKATGPAGAPGAPGVAGAAGANGTARAYATVQTFTCQDTPPDPCDFDRDKGISSVTRTGTGQYCVVAPGIDAKEVSPSLTVNWSETNNPEGNGTVQEDRECPAPDTGFFVRTERWANPGNSAADDNVAFTIVIP